MTSLLRLVGKQVSDMYARITRIKDTIEIDSRNSQEFNKILLRTNYVTSSHELFIINTLVVGCRVMKEPSPHHHRKDLSIQNPLHLPFSIRLRIRISINLVRKTQFPEALQGQINLFDNTNFSGDGEHNHIDMNLYLSLLPLSLQGLNQAAYRRFSSAAPTTKLFIDGKFVESQTKEWIDLHDPATNDVVTRVPKATASEMESALQSSRDAYKSWSQTSILTRQAVMMKFAHIIKQNMGELAKNITKEQGKTLVDAEGDVLRGLRTCLIL